MASTATTENQVDAPLVEDGGGWIDAVLAFIARYREASIAVVAILLVVYIQARNSIFLTASEMSVVLRDTGRIGLVTAGIVFVMITGEIDLSVGGTFALAPIVMAYMNTSWGWSMWLAAPLAILIGVGVGLINGVITVKLRIPSLITTLGTFFLLSGITVTIAHSQPIQIATEEPFNLIFGENRFGPLDPLFSWHGLTGFTPMLWALGVVLVLTVVLIRTVFGLHIVAPGSNILAAREIGVRTDRIKIATFMMLGGLAALDGVIIAVESGSAPSDTTSAGALTLYAIAAAVIGGTALTGGSGTVIGGLLGAFVVACINNGLVFLGVQATQSDIYLGAAIIGAMILNVQVDRVRLRRKG